MKIKRFNEKVSSDVEEFLYDFEGTVDYSILDWIASMARSSDPKWTKLTEYSDIDYENLNSLKKLSTLIETKNLKNYRKLLDKELEIEQLNKRIEQLVNQRDKLKIDVNNEVMYKFQTDLLENDIEGFYKLFLSSEIETIIENDYEYDIIYEDVHPNILKNKKYKNIIDNIEEVKEYKIKRDSNKYNL